MKSIAHDAKILEDLIPRAFEDKGFREKLLSNPKQVLEEYGFNTRGLDDSFWHSILSQELNSLERKQIELSNRLAGEKKIFNDLMVRALEDIGFREKLLSNPKQVLAENGVKYLTENLGDSYLRSVLSKDINSMEKKKTEFLERRRDDALNDKKIFLNLLAKANEDIGFREKLLSNPKQVLAENGVKYFAKNLDDSFLRSWVRSLFVTRRT